ncbi:MarR family winged helix-turn-helix transcriptional regulator [Oceanospirillum linum]|uniref:MarR family transcriptional regulator n=1 Tax=Oceanospirillum linum TaxID=966 RepID=A0A1T1H8D5_OCELI|nr:MarR family transcriptional regulator [Oceanospirillum linum]OOV85990.1 MarR family transcriptional regulator [Oceanospirillum linum]SEG44330.1 DNA-binding transcriptional regulator, MarR family [Oleiphilus messinensis]SMP34334.1 transcriptional regulator, MarR family [Oceanospirillum linum]
MKASVIESTFHLAHAIKQRLSCQLEANEMDIAPMHVRVLNVIGRQTPCTAIDIATLFKRDKAQITRLVKPLIEQGLVQKEPNPEDKRSQFLVLTPEGIALQESLDSFAQQMQKEVTEGVDADDLATFLRVAEQITANFSKRASEG